MARTNVAAVSTPVFTHEGASAARISTLQELKRSVLTCMLWEPSFYESGASVAARIAELCAQVDPQKLADLAVEARDRMKLRHVPLFLVRELARRKGNGTLVAETLPRIIQRPDELAEFVSIYWKDKKQPLSAGVKRGLAAAFRRFDQYAISKWNRDNAIKLRDVLFLVHAKPKDEAQAETWKKLAGKTLESPDTWEVSLSGGADKREVFERLLREKALGGMAVLQNLRNMQQAGVDEDLIRERIENGISKALPYRFIVAAKHAPRFEPSLELGMLKAAQDLPPLNGATGLLIDVSGSMDYKLGNHNESRTFIQPELRASVTETSRIDAACGLAILLREKCPDVRIATFSHEVIEVPARCGFALRDAVANSQVHGGTELKKALTTLRGHFAWKGIERLIVITDEQSQDGITDGWAPKSYLINVASYANGIGYGNGWHHIDGWSEACLDYIREFETDYLAA